MSPRLFMAAAFALLFAGETGALGQASAVRVEQLTPATRATSPRLGSTLAVPPVHGTRSSASSDERTRPQVGSVSSEVVEACRKARAEDRAPPKGVDCTTALQASAASAPPTTAEGSLLPLFGQPVNVFTSTDARLNARNADAVARQLSTGDVGSQSAGEAAAIASRQAAPPPTSSPH